MKPRACKPPVMGRDVAPTSLVVQQDLPFDVGAATGREEVSARDKSRPVAAPTAAPVERLWFCVWLPHLPLESVSRPTCPRGAVAAPTAVVEEQHGIHRILLADAEARAAGVMRGQAANAALALLPGLVLEERSLLREQQALEGLETWLERFSSFVSIADHNVLLL